MTDTNRPSFSPIYDLEEPLRDLARGADVMLLVAEGIRQGMLETRRAGEALLFIAFHMEGLAVEAEKAFEAAFDHHVRTRRRETEQ